MTKPSGESNGTESAAPATASVWDVSRVALMAAAWSAFEEANNEITQRGPTPAPLPGDYMELCLPSVGQLNPNYYEC